MILNTPLPSLLLTSKSIHTHLHKSHNKILTYKHLYIALTRPKKRALLQRSLLYVDLSIIIGWHNTRTSTASRCSCARIAAESAAHSTADASASMSLTFRQPPHKAAVWRSWRWCWSRTGTRTGCRKCWSKVLGPDNIHIAHLHELYRAVRKDQIQADNAARIWRNRRCVAEELPGHLTIPGDDGSVVMPYSPSVDFILKEI